MKQITTVLFTLMSVFCYSQIVSIPDINFKNALLKHDPVVDLNNDGEIQLSEAAIFTDNLNLDNNNISSLTGIEAFTSITFLTAEYNQINALDVSSNINLELLALYSNLISELDLSQNLNLMHLDCQLNNITTLDLSSNMALEFLHCANNPLINLNILQNINLETILIGNTPINTLDLSGNPNLEFLYCAFNELQELDVHNLPLLHFLWCNNNSLEILNLKSGQNIILTDLHAYNNPDLVCIEVDNEEDATNGIGAYNTWLKDETASYSKNCLPLGINDFSNIELIVFPNPVQNTLRILTNYEIDELSLFSTSGKTIKTYTNSKSVNISDLQPGLYFLKCAINNTIYTKKILKK